MKFTYRGVVSRQVDGGPDVVLFSAPAVDIERWAGIPQRRRIEVTDEAVETAGFQRESKRSRVDEIAKFMQNHANVIQNPLLAAVQEASEIYIEIESDGVCTVSITDPDLSQKSLLELIDGAREQLRRRLPELGTRQVSSDTLKGLRAGLADHYDALPSEDQQEYEDDAEYPDGDDDSPDAPENDIGAGLFNEETQVVDFYDELNARSRILNELGDAAAGLDVIGGFSRAYLESLLRPVVLVDGQHRLLGALAAIESHPSATPTDPSMGPRRGGADRHLPPAHGNDAHRGPRPE